MSAPGTAESTEAIARARAGDQEAWGDLYREYAPAIFRFCRRALPTREDAEDATMEVFVKVRDKLHQYDPTRPFSSWLYKVAANHCWDLLRRRKIRQDKETEDLETLPLEHPDADQLEQPAAERRTGAAGYGDAQGDRYALRRRGLNGRSGPPAQRRVREARLADQVVSASVPAGPDPQVLQHYAACADRDAHAPAQHL